VTLENLDSLDLAQGGQFFSLTQALDYLAMRLVDEFDVQGSSCACRPMVPVRSWI
jgi:hypothetical protein